MNSKKFIKALTENDLKLLKKVEKSDLHNHAMFGSSYKFFRLYFPNYNLPEFKKSNSIISISKYIKNNLLPLSTDINNYTKLIICTILTAIDDGITKLELSLDSQLANFFNNIDDMIIYFEKVFAPFSNKIFIYPELGISRHSFKENDSNLIKELIKTKFFFSIDLYGDELSKPIEIFYNIFSVAYRNGLKNKAHIGEFGTCFDIIKAIELLNLSVIQHGIAIVNDNNCLEFAKRNNIQFNLCISSNLKLSRVSSVKKHPIKKMFDSGLKITINSDDILLFNSTVSNEYMVLFKNNILTAQELNLIRKNGLGK